MNFDEIKDRLDDFIQQTQQYFFSLNEHEKYGWIGESTGFVFFIVGVVLLIL